MKTFVFTTLLALATGGIADAVDFSVLSDFEYTEGMTLPTKVTKYDGKEVQVSGFMKREVAGEGEVGFFVLINDACGCTGEPMLNEVIYCQMPFGETTEIKSGIVTLTGTLGVGEQEDDGIVWGIYTMDVTKVH